MMTSILQPQAEGAEGDETLAALRARIETIDSELVRLLGERVALARSTHDAKQRLGRPTLDPSREAAVVRRAGCLARAAALPEEPVRELFWAIMALSRDVQHGEHR